MQVLDLFEEESSVSLGGPVVTKTAAYTTTVGDKTILYNHSANVTLTLATACLWAGKRFTIKDKSGTAGTNVIHIIGEGGETIDGAASYDLNVNYGSIDVVCDGANWFIV